MRTLLTSTLILLINHINAKTVEESSTGALLTFPAVLDGPLYGMEFDVAPAQFGYQKYGGTLEGLLILPANETYHKECPKCGGGVNSMCTDQGPEPLDTNPYIHWIRDWFISKDDMKDYILVIDRLDCYFVEKIEHAQEMGASGVIMCDWRPNGNLFTMWMPQDWNDDIDIPAVLLSNSDCQTLMEHIGVNNWDPNEHLEMEYPDPDVMNWTIATIEWGLPHPDDLVEYELWTSSNDYLGSKFKHNFNDTAIALDKAKDTRFTPHMYILNGSHWNCDEMFNGTHLLPCKQQCTNNGRYCAVDPEYDLSIGLDGMDVVQENLRSLCVWKYDETNFGFDDVMWWDYAVLWDENCGVYSNTSTNFNEACSYAQMDKLKTDGSLSTSVKQCIADSGGYGYEDGNNTILHAECKLKYTNSIYAVPLVRVNEFLIHGNIDCDPPVTTATCEVLAAICAGFINGTQPDVCKVTPAPTIVTCTDDQLDCNGTCYGPHHTDACGKCLTYSDPNWNECIGCNGQINETFDCEGTCGGHYGVNVCGYCLDKRSTVYDWQTYGVDCNDGCDINLKEDECGQCLYESDLGWNSCIDCEGVAGGGKQENECGFCKNPSDADFETYGKNCNGDCTAQSEEVYSLDRCGICKTSEDSTRDACVGCDNVADSNKILNPCGVCVNKDDENFADYGKDCRGECTTTIANTYYVDDCGNCLLPSSDEWNSCLPNVEPTNTETTTLKKKESELTTVIVIVCIVAFLIILAACIIIGALWKKQTQINERFDSLAATYVTMEDNPASGGFPQQMGNLQATTGTYGKKQKKGMTEIGDESGEDE
eukprot:CAMPEP_0201571072 /NCGR_PEP_ID=MMETSP0190_2-20130828/13660_1 /ASSEMBLY_ACC=CAM_ASM_000263 /TAXON_ID=37353 /ORGANISM="Rosalina sp." /LENGTH=819 /DNA_ID=CAMNT_0047995337 /DNA_START=127 /DNA_END=2586 /DNA_ORIENTATION=+